MSKNTESHNKSVVALSHKGQFEICDKVLYCGHNGGFFSNCTVTLWNLIELYRKQNLMPSRIDFSRAFSFYRTQAEKNKEVDLYPFFFKTNINDSIKLRKRISKVDHHGIYKFIDFFSYNLLIKQYFELSESVLKIQNMLKEKYDIEPSRTIAVIYRGTDKHREVKIASPELYLRKAKKLLYYNPTNKVLIQTDDIKVRDLFVDSLGEKCFFFKEMPVTDEATAIHELNEEILQMSKMQFAQLLLSVTHFLSKSNYIINYTGNMALWICLFRGNSENVFQFDKSGKLVTFWQQVVHVLKYGLGSSL